MKCTKKGGCTEGCDGICKHYAANSNKWAIKKEQRMGLPKKIWDEYQAYLRQERRIKSQQDKAERLRERHENYIARIEKNRIKQDQLKQESWERKQARDMKKLKM